MLDREEQEVYTLVIQAKDSPLSTSLQLSDSLVVKIRLIDINDNSPYCERDTYWVKINQNTDVNTSLIHIKGVDHDAGNNAKIFYSLKLLNNSNENNLFEINKDTGLVQVKRKLLGLTGTLIYKIGLRDDGESSRTNSCTLVVLIKDFNAYPPKFIYPNENNSSIRIRTGLPLGSHMMTASAFDPDYMNMTNQMTYTLDNQPNKNQDWKSFTINSTTGVLSLNATLNLNRQSIYLVNR